MTTKEPEPTTTEEEKDSPKGLREAKKRSDERADNYRRQLVAARLTDIGLSSSEGLGVAIAESFDGEPTGEAIAEYAADKYKYTFDASKQVVTSTPAEQHQQAVEGGSAVMQRASSLVPDEELQERAKQVDERFNPDPSDNPTYGELQQGIADKMNAHTQQ